MTTNKPLRYIAYVRKSEERKERQELSHQAQITEIKKRFPDLNIVKWMPAESKSAFEPGRTIFNEMIEMIKRGEADAIVGWHPNRLSRNELDSAIITYMLRNELKDLKFCTFNFDNSAEGIMMLQMVMNQSQYESSKQGRDVKRGMTQKATNGERPGQVPQGYMKKPVIDANGEPIKKKDNKIVTETRTDPERYDLVVRMWQMLLSREYNASQIGRIARNEWGFTTRKTQKIGGNLIYSSLVYKIFTNPFYAGYIAHNGELIKGNHRAMITLDEFDIAQKLLGDKGKPRSSVYDYAFTGLIKCGECGCSIVGKTNAKFVKREDKFVEYVHYYCTRKSNDRPCNQKKYTRVEILEHEIDEELKKYEIMKEFKDFALEILQRNNEVEARSHSRIYQTQQNKLLAIQDKLDKLIDMRTRDLLDDEEYFEQKNRLKLDRSRLEDSLRSTNDRTDDWMNKAEEVFSFAVNAPKKFMDGSKAEKRRILINLGQNLILKDGKLSITPYEWLVPIAESYPEIEKAYLKVRTNKIASPKVREEAIASIFESWRASGDLNPGHPA